MGKTKLLFEETQQRQLMLDADYQYQRFLKTSVNPLYLKENKLSQKKIKKSFN